MQGQHQHSHHGGASQGRGPEMFYGYCHESRRLRMMDYPDYMKNMQTGYSNLYGNPAAAMQPMLDALSTMMRPQGASTDSHPHHHDCGCRHDEGDCACTCCIRCADLVEYVRCGEVRRIPITFDNDTRRERDVTLQLGNFATESGQNMNWQAALSTTQFKLPPCGELTVLLTVNVDCGKLTGVPNPNPNPNPTPAPVPNPNAGGTVERQGTVDRCTVAYATLRAEGCTIRPMVIAVAVLPEQCGAHRAGCGCGCCH